MPKRRPPKHPTVKTTREFFEHVLTVEKLAKCLGQKPKAVTNWKYFGYFPAHAYLAVKKLAAMQGRQISDDLFAMLPLVDVPRQRGPHGRFVSPVEPVQPDDNLWRDSQGHVVSPEMQDQLTWDALHPQYNPYTGVPE